MKYRNNGAIGALLDEYEKSLNELIEVISEISDESLIKVVDLNTDDMDCRSIQTILTHVVESGYTYVIEIRKWLGEECQYKDKEVHNYVNGYVVDLREMFKYNEKLFIDYPTIKIYEVDPALKVKARWGQECENIYRCWRD